MNDALPVPVQNEYFDEVPESFNCPICFHLPRKMFQCKKGHWLCCSCHKLSKICPSCKVQFDQKEPIRNLFFESELDRFVKVDCANKLNGCEHKPTRILIQAHQSKCYFNFERFGKLMNVCELIGYKNCDFRFNTGNTDDAVIHYASFHDCLSVEDKHMQMELTGFREAAEAGADENCLWTPIISNLKDKNCFLLASAIFNGKRGALYCFSIVTSKLNESSAALTMEYKLTSQNNIFECGYLQSCIPLSEVESLPNKVTCFVLPQKFKSYFTEDGSLLVNCILHESNANSGVDEMTLQRIMCTKRTTSLDVQLPVPCPCTEEETEDGNIETSEDSTTGYNEKNTRVCKQFTTTEIFVSNLPDVTSERVTAFFAKFGDVTGVEMFVLEWDIYKKLDRFNLEGPKSCRVKFADTSAVAKVMERKRRMFLNVNGKKHRLNATTTDSVNNILTLEREKISDEFMAQAEEACKENKDAVFEYVREAFSKTSDPVVFQYITRRMTFEAASSGTLESLKYCIEKGVEVNLYQLHPNPVFGVRFNLMLHTVCNVDKKIGLEKMKFLVENGADLHFEDDIGSLLHVIVDNGSDEMLKFCLENGLDVNQRNDIGATPLLLTVYRGVVKRFGIENAKLLLQYGADINIPDNDGRTPWDDVHATSHEHRDILLKLFRKHNPQLKLRPKLRMRASLDK